MEVGDVTYTRSIELAMDVIRLKSPITVRSSGRQSRLGDCATAVAVAANEINRAPRVRIRGMYTSTLVRFRIGVHTVWGRGSSSRTGGCGGGGERRSTSHSRQRSESAAITSIGR